VTKRASIESRAKALLAEVPLVLRALRDPRTPWLARLLGLATLAYALSPIDLIPDFIPVLGQLDDLIVVPLGVALVIRMIPREVMDEARRQGDATADSTASLGRVGVVLTALTWVFVLTTFGVWIAGIVR